MTAPVPKASDWAGWRWPVLPWGRGEDQRLPVVSHEFEGGARFLPNGNLNYAVHLGLDVMFAWREGDPIGPPEAVAMFKGKPRRGYIAPMGCFVVAAGPGTVWAAGPSKLGLHVQLDHGTVGDAGGVNTYYQHLTSFARPWMRGDEVKAGDVLGIMGGDPANAPHLRHLHFELWFPRKGVQAAFWPTDPAPYMQHWHNGPMVGVA